MWTIAKNGFRECLRYRVVYYIFAMALLFILMGKGCNPGAIKGNDLFFDDQARQNLAVATAFHLIVFWSMMLSGLVSAQVLTRELEDGTALLTLSRPLSRWGFLAGKVLSVMMLT
ncbi:MAG: ABC transporter permease, partial [Deltaproteobacteria bacterium]|nr:ABC transporter permease [Deltaproteobacteria bacterium]